MVPYQDYVASDDPFWMKLEYVLSALRTRYSTRKGQPSASERRTQASYTAFACEPALLASNNTLA